MTGDTIRSITSSIRNRSGAPRRFLIFDKILTVLVVSLYICLFIYNHNSFFCCIISLVVPLTGFVFVSIFRALTREERPYEKYNFEPVIPKDTKKHSFPSRHVFSAAVIAGTWIVFFPAVGAGLIAITALIAILRVICGLHYIHDVVAGGLMGFAWGVFGTIIMI